MTYRLAQRRYVGRGFTSMRGRADVGGLNVGTSPVGVCAATGNAEPADRTANPVIAINCLTDMDTILADPLIAA
jgi:hypothetical protein